MSKKPPVYEGTDPYIFVSYAHKDAEQVFRVLNELTSQGYRVWYDDGIAPGSEWPEDIAQHLVAAEVVIAFITERSVSSANCRREINFALSKEKSFLSIFLEQTQMPLGLEMQLSAQQSILLYNYNSWDSFIKKILTFPNALPCKGAVTVQLAQTTTAQFIAPLSEDAATPASDSAQLSGRNLYSVILTGFRDSKMKTEVNTIKVIRKLMGTSISQAHTDAKAIPLTVRTGLSKSEAEQMCRVLEAAGGITILEEFHQGLHNPK